MSLSRVPWIVACLVLSAAPYIASDDGDVCAKVPNNLCSCVFPNGTGIDLSPGVLSLGKSYSEEGTEPNRTLSLHTFYFHPCKDVVINVTDKPVENFCKNAVAICKQTLNTSITVANATENTFKVVKSSKYESYGSNPVSQFSVDGRSIIYDNNPSHTTVRLECTPNAIEDTISVDESEGNAVVLTLYSRNACLKEIQAVSHRSTGSTLLIVFFTLVLFYLVLGMCTKKFLMGAQGIEVIPNLTFWRDLPGLCRDGWLFLRSGCRPPPRSAAGPSSPDPNSYDSI